VKYADDFLLLANGGTMLQGVIQLQLSEAMEYKLTWKAKVMRISRQLSEMQIMAYLQQPEGVEEHFNYLPRI
jgi:hypothetical protein